MEVQASVEPLIRAPSRWARWRRRVLVAFALLLFAASGFALFLATCFATPPELQGRPAVLDLELRTEPDGRRVLGESWFLRREGASLLRLEGDPYTLGYSNAALTADLLEQQERELMGTVRHFFPSTVGFMAITALVLINNRSLPDYVPLEYQLEILGLSQGGPDPFPDFGPRYHRILNYHAAHDISHWVWDKPVVGCTAFAARGQATRDGGLLVGRNFDFEAGREFDTNKIIGLYRPQRGYAFLSVSWPGMAGAVTGLNAQRIFCSINGAHSEDKGRIGEPVSLVVREVLQYAGTIEEAVKIVRAAQVFVTDGYLLADGKTGEAVVVEKSPGRTEVRRIEGDVLLQANHFETQGFGADVGNAQYMREGTTLARHARLEELVKGASGLTPERAVEILRDVQGAHGAQIALGNRSAINALIATHTVVAEVSRGILWVSRGPHQLGQFDAYSIEDFGAEVAPPIPPDPLLASGAYRRVTQARTMIKASRGDPQSHQGDLLEALELNPGDPEALYLLGKALAAEGESAAARARFEAALAANPPFLAQVEEVRAALRALGQAP